MSNRRVSDDVAAGWRSYPQRPRALLACVLLPGLVLALGLAANVLGATRTWTGLGPTNNWSDPLNWSGNLVPGAADLATFDGTSAKNAIIILPVNVAGVSIGAGYGGTITQNSGVAMTVGATGLSQSGGSFVGGTSAITVNGPFALSGGSFAATTGTLSVSGAFSVSGGSYDPVTGTTSFGGGAATLTVSTPDTFNNVRLASGAKTVAGGTTLTVTGTLTLTDGTLAGGTVAALGAISQASTFDGGAGTLLVAGTGPQTFTGAATTAAGTLPLLVINKPSGTTLSLAGTIRTTNNWTYLGGTVDPGTSTVVFAGTQTITGSHALTDVVVIGTGAKTVAGGTTLTVTGTLTLTDGTLAGGTVAALGAISQASTFDGGAGTLLVAGTGPQTFTGAATTAAGTLPLLVINKPSGTTLSLAGTIRTANNWTYLGGTVDPGTSTVVFAGTQTITGSHALTDVVVIGTGAKTVAGGTTLTVTGTLTLTDGTLAGGTVAALGAISQASTFDGGAGTLLVAGTGPQTFTGAATTAAGTLPLLVINKPSGTTLSLAGTIRTTNNWTYLGGTVDPGTSTVVFAGGTITGSHALNALDLRATTSIAAGTTLTVTGDTTLSVGSLNGTGTLAALGAISQTSAATGGAGTLLVAGTGPQTFTGAATTAAGTLPLLVINKPSGTTLSLAGTIRTTNNWTYLGGTVDPGTSTVVFAGTQTITGSHALTDVVVIGTGAKTVAGGTTLTVTGTLTLTDGTLAGGTVAALGAISQASTFDGGAGTLLVAGTGPQTFTGAATTAAGTLPLLVINKPSGTTLSLAGTIRTTNNWTYLGGTVDPGTSTVVFAGTQTITGSHALTDVVVIGTGAKTVAGGTTLTVTGTLTLTDGTLAGGTVAALGAISQASTFDGGAGTLLVAGTGPQTFTGAATTAAGTLPLLVINKPSGTTLSLAGTIRTTNNWTYLGGTVDPGTSTVVFAGGVVLSAGMVFYDLTANGGTVTLGSSAVIARDFTVLAGTFTTSASNYGLTIGRNMTVGATFRANGSPIDVAGDLTNNGTIVPGTSTLTLDGVAGQSIGGSVALPAFNLVVDDPLGVSVATNVTVTGTLTLVSGQVSLNAHRLTISNAIAGTPNNLVGGPASSLTVTGAGTGIIVPGSVTQLSALTLSNSNGLSLQADLTVGSLLTLTVGRLDTGAGTLVIGPGGGVVRTTGWVVGKLQKHAPAGLATGLGFEVGDAVSYAPVTVAFGTVTAPGDLVASTTSGDHPDLANAGLAVGQSVNRFWTVTNIGVAFDTYAATLAFTTADVDAGADPASFIVAKRDGGSWTRPSVGTRTALSIETTGMTSFSDFAVGEPTADLGITVSDGLATVIAGDAATHQYVITVTNAGPSDATGVLLADTWPADFSAGVISPSQGSCTVVGAGPDFGCDLGTLPAGASATVTVPYTVAADTEAGPRTEAVSVTSSVVDPSDADNAATDTTTVVETAVLLVTNDDGLASAVAGTTGHAFTITVTNQGPSDAENVALDDSLPGAFSAGTPSADLGGDCSGSIGNAVHCALSVTLAPGETWTVIVPYGIDSSVPAQTVVATSVATSNENPGGVAASDTTDVTTTGRPWDHGQRRAGDGDCRRCRDPPVRDHRHQRRPVGRDRRAPGGHLAGGLQRGRHQPVPGQLHGRWRRPRLRLRSGHPARRCERHRDRAVHRRGRYRGRPPDRGRQRHELGRRPVGRRQRGDRYDHGRRRGHPRHGHAWERLPRGAVCGHQPAPRAPPHHVCGPRAGAPQASERRGARSLTQAPSHGRSSRARILPAGEWRNGRRAGLRSRCPARGVRVRPPPCPLLLRDSGMLPGVACAAPAAAARLGGAVTSGRDGQPNLEPRLVDVARCGHGTARCLDDGFHDRQAEAGVAARPARGVARLEEPVEDPRKVARRDRRPRVGHGDDRVAGLARRGDPDCPAERRVADGVVHQVHHGLGHAVGVGHDRQRSVALDRDVPVRADDPRRGPDVVDEQPQVDRARIEATAAGFELGQQEQVRRKAGQAIDLAPHRSERPRLRGRVRLAAGEDVDVAAEDR